MRQDYDHSKSAEPLVLTVNDIVEGQEASICAIIDAAVVDAFAELTGDANPLHMDDAFASERGFERRVVHGVLLAGYVSRVLGMLLPGRDCLLHSLRLNFLKPAYVGDEIAVRVVARQVSTAVSALVLDVAVDRVSTGDRLARGQVHAGFTGAHRERAAPPRKGAQ